MSSLITSAELVYMVACTLLVLAFFAYVMLTDESLRSARASVESSTSTGV